MARPQRRRQLRLQGGRDVLAHEEAVELTDNEGGAGGVLEEQIDDVLPVERARAAENGLRLVIVQRGAFDELVVLESPAGEGACRLLDVVLRVVADAQAEQLEELPRKVFVRVAFDVRLPIEVDEHGGVLADAEQELAEIAVA